MTRNPELPKRRIVARIDVQADSWKDLHWAIAKARERAMESAEEHFLSAGGRGCSFGFRIDVDINESQTAESYQRELSAWIHGDSHARQAERGGEVANYRYVSLPVEIEEACLPVEIEAFQMTPERRYDNTDWPEWLNRAWNGIRNAKGTMQIDHQTTLIHDCDLEIVTLEGNHRVSWGDYIIRGTIGELYPCKPEVFERKYRKVVEPKS